MAKFGFIEVPGGSDGIDLGPISLEKQETKILSGGTEAVKALTPEDLNRIAEKTQNPEVAIIILGIGEEALFDKLMKIYRYGHGEEWLKKLREEGKKKIVKTLRRLAKKSKP